jgi:hypothetical protein
MKKNRFLLALAFVSIGTYLAAQTTSPDEQVSTKNHIRVVTVKDGVTEVLDTIITDGKAEVKFLKGNNHFTFSRSGEPGFEWEEIIENDSTKKIVVMKRRSGDQENRMMVAPLPPGAPVPPMAPGMRFLQHRSGNVIDLSDPGVISYKKKKLSGGREKITIIRNEVTEKQEKDVLYIIDRDQKLFHFDGPKPMGELEFRKP